MLNIAGFAYGDVRINTSNQNIALNLVHKPNIMLSI